MPTEQRAGALQDLSIQVLVRQARELGITVQPNGKICIQRQTWVGGVTHGHRRCQYQTYSEAWRSFHHTIVSLAHKAGKLLKSRTDASVSPKTREIAVHQLEQLANISKRTRCQNLNNLGLLVKKILPKLRIEENWAALYDAIQPEVLRLLELEEKRVLDLASRAQHQGEILRALWLKDRDRAFRLRLPVINFAKQYDRLSGNLVHVDALPWLERELGKILNNFSDFDYRCQEARKALEGVRCELSQGQKGSTGKSLLRRAQALLRDYYDWLKTEDREEHFAYTRNFMRTPI